VRQKAVLDAQLKQDEKGPDVNVQELYDELCKEIRGMQTMATPSEVAAAMEDRDASPQSAVRQLASAMARSSESQPSRGASGGAASVSRRGSTGFEDAVLSHLGTIADSMSRIAGALGTKPSAVVSALQILNATEGEDEDAQKDGDKGGSSTSVSASRAPVRSCAYVANVRSHSLLCASCCRKKKRKAQASPGESTDDEGEDDEVSASCAPVRISALDRIMLIMRACACLCVLFTI